MKSKKLLVFLIMFVFITVLVVLNSTLFTLQHISISWLTSTINLKTMNEKEVTSLIDERGESIFLLNKEEISAKLEKKHPYLRVVGIETKFPNKIVIYSAEREDLYAVKIADGDYAIIDDYGKVLSRTQTLSTNSNGAVIEARPIEVLFNNIQLNSADFLVGEQFNNIQLNSADFLVGEQVKIKRIEEVLTKLSYTLKEANYTTLAKKGIFDSITVANTGEGGEVGMYLTTRNGMVINLLDAEDKMTDKFMLGLSVYNEYHQDSYSKGTIIVQYSHAEEKIIAYFDDEID